jgi:hypothetical protein
VKLIPSCNKEMHLVLSECRQNNNVKPKRKC